MAVLIKKAVAIPSNYGMTNGSILMEATGGRKPYLFSVDGGLTYQNKSEFTVYGGTYDCIVKDSDGECSEVMELVVEKVLSAIQKDFLNNLFDSMGNESQAARITSTGDNQYLTPRTVANWRKDIDFAKFVAEVKIDGDLYFKDYLESKGMQLVNGGIPIYQFVPDPNAATDEDGNVIDVTKRIKIQVGETLPDASMIRFFLERRFKNIYSQKTEIGAGAGGSGKVIAIAYVDDFGLDFEKND